MTISIAIEPVVTEVTATGDSTVVDITTSTTTVEVSAAIPALSANAIVVTPYGTVTESTLQGALEQLADQSFRSGVAPTTNIELGDVWYDTTNNIFFVYRTVDGTTDWYPLLNSDADNADGLDGGAF